MNVALEWPAMKGVDMTSPADIEKAAQFVAEEPTQERRRNALFELAAIHKPHSYGLIEKRARQIHQKRGRR